MPIGGEHAERDGDQHGKQDREERQRHRGLQPIEDQLGHLLLEEEGLAQVAVQRLAGPDDELREDRLVEPQALADLGHLLGVGVVAGDDGRRVGRRQAQHQEDEHRDDDHHGDRRGQPAQDVAEHRFRAIRCRRGRLGMHRRTRIRDASVDGDVPEHRRRRRQHAVHVLAHRRAQVPLAQRNVRHHLALAHLHGLGDGLLLGRIGLAGEVIPQLLHLLVAGPAEHRLVAGGVHEAGEDRIGDVDRIPRT